MLCHLGQSSQFLEPLLQQHRSPGHLPGGAKPCTDWTSCLPYLVWRGTVRGDTRDLGGDTGLGDFLENMFSRREELRLRKVAVSYRWHRRFK